MRNVAFVSTVLLVVVLFIGVLYLVRGQTPTSTALASATPTASVTVTATPAAAATTAAASTSAPTPSGTYVNPTYKFSLTLPEPYRKSARLSATDTSRGNPAAAVAVDAFTVRTDQDEAPLAGKICDSTCAIRNYVAIVEISIGVSQTPRQWYTSRESAADQRIDDVTVDGRTAIRVTNGAGIYVPVQLIVKDGDRMFRVGYYITPDPVPAGASKEKLEGILASFKFLP